MFPPSIPTDTSPEVFELLVQQWRSMSIAERAGLVDRLHLDVEVLAVAGIRATRPGISDVELRRELVRRRYGASIAAEAFDAATA